METWGLASTQDSPLRPRGCLTSPETVPSGQAVPSCQKGPLILSGLLRAGTQGPGPPDGMSASASPPHVPVILLAKGPLPHAFLESCHVPAASAAVILAPRSLKPHTSSTTGPLHVMPAWPEMLSPTQTSRDHSPLRPQARTRSRGWLLPLPLCLCGCHVSNM